MLAISGSFKGKQGWTWKLLQSFLSGATGSGAKTELLDVNDFKIEPCSAEFNCWFTEPGVCIHGDGMYEINLKIKEAETLVLGIPMYSPLPGAMQNLLNRLCPLVEPILQERDGRTRASFRADVSVRRIALVAASGWWELANLDTVVHIVEELAANCNVEYAGAVLRPHAFVMGRDKERMHGIMDAVQAAGRELAETGRISRSTTDRIAVPLVPFDQFREEFTDQYLQVRD